MGLKFKLQVVKSGQKGDYIEFGVDDNCQEEFVKFVKETPELEIKIN